MRADHQQNIDTYLAAVVDKGLCADEGKLRFQMKCLYGEIDFSNKSVLDIGGGSGIHSYYAACCGARKVVCLEPEARGSSKGVFRQFQQLGEILQYNNVVIEPVLFQEYNCGSDTFDVIILHNSINHLKETACINLLKDARSAIVYQDIFAKIKALSKKGTKLLICDCSRYNFFALIGIRNPFVPTIAWHKHQAPKVWTSMLRDVGFVNPTIKWSSFNRLGRWGRFLLGNKWIAFFLTSHFCLTMEKA